MGVHGHGRHPRRVAVERDAGHLADEAARAVGAHQIGRAEFERVARGVPGGDRDPAGGLGVAEVGEPAAQVDALFDGPFREQVLGGHLRQDQRVRELAVELVVAQPDQAGVDVARYLEVGPPPLGRGAEPVHEAADVEQLQHARLDHSGP